MAHPEETLSVRIGVLEAPVNGSPLFRDTMLVCVINCLRSYCDGERFDQAKSVLRDVVRLATNASSCQCRFKLFVEKSSPRIL